MMLIFFSIRAGIILRPDLEKVKEVEKLKMEQKNFFCSSENVLCASDRKMCVCERVCVCAIMCTRITVCACECVCERENEGDNGPTIYCLCTF